MGTSLEKDLDEEALLYVFLVWWHQMQAAKRTMWTRQWNLCCRASGAHMTLVQELDAEDPEKF